VGLAKRKRLFGGLCPARRQVNRPGPIGVCTRRELGGEVLEVFERQRRLLPDLHVGQVVVPDALGRRAFREEQQLRLHARASGAEDAARQRKNAPEIALVRELALGLDEPVLICSEQNAFVESAPSGVVSVPTLCVQDRPSVG